MDNHPKGIVQFLIEAEEKRIGRHLSEDELHKLQNSSSYKTLSWLESILKLRMPSPSSPSKQSADAIVHKSNFIVQALFGLFSLAIIVFIYITIRLGLQGNIKLLPNALLIVLLLTALLFVKNLFSVWAHLTLQYVLMSEFIIYFTNLTALKGWAAFAAMVPWLVRLAAYLIAAGIAVLLAFKIGELVLRVKCPEMNCGGWCKREDIYPVTFLCASCGKKYITTIFIQGRR